MLGNHLWTAIQTMGFAGPLDAPVIGAELRMKESCRKGVANHPDPESCGVGRKDDAEALTGARAGEVLSREINVSGTPTL